MLPFLTRVEVKPGIIRRLLGAKPRRGYIAFGEIGKYSKKRLYSVVYEGGAMGAVFEHELKVLEPKRSLPTGETLH